MGTADTAYIITLSKSAPEEFLLKQLQSAVSAHLQSPSEETKEKLIFDIKLLSMRYLTEKQTIAETIKDCTNLTEAQKMYDLLKR